MRTVLVVLIMLVRFGPDLVYAANATLPQPAPARRTTEPKRFVGPPAVVAIRPPH